MAIEDPMISPLNRPGADATSPLLFALGGSDELARNVALALGVELAAHEVRDFEDGEHKIRPLVSVRNRDVFVLTNLVGSPGASVHDKLCQVLFFVGAFRGR